MRKPRERRSRPKTISGRSCSSPGAQASRTRGPPPSSHPRASPSSRPRMTLLAKCSCADRRLARLPPLSESVQVRQDDLAEQRLDGVDGEQAVELALCSTLVEPVEGSAESAGVRVERSTGRGGVLRRGRGEPRGLGRGQAGGEVRLHAADAFLVRRGVEPKAAVGSDRPEEPVAALPGPQELRADGRPTAQLADAEAVLLDHRHIVQNLYGHSTRACAISPFWGRFRAAPSASVPPFEREPELMKRHRTTARGMLFLMLALLICDRVSSRIHRGDRAEQGAAPRLPGARRSRVHRRLR